MRERFVLFNELLTMPWFILFYYLARNLLQSGKTDITIKSILVHCSYFCAIKLATSSQRLNACPQ